MTLVVGICKINKFLNKQTSSQIQIKNVLILSVCFFIDLVSILWYGVNLGSNLCVKDYGFGLWQSLCRIGAQTLSMFMLIIIFYELYKTMFQIQSDFKIKTIQNVSVISNLTQDQSQNLDKSDYSLNSPTSSHHLSASSLSSTTRLLVENQITSFLVETEQSGRKNLIFDKTV